MAEKKSILLIDDDNLVLTTLSKLLENAGHQVSAFTSAKAAIDAASMEDFDLVITDIRMPEVDGIQVIRYIREIRSSKGKPAMREILMTGYAQEYEDKAKQLSPHAFVHKPFDLNEFLGVVEEAFK